MLWLFVVLPLVAGALAYVRAPLPVCSFVGLVWLAGTMSFAAASVRQEASAG
jgi:hypothetical protein